MDELESKTNARRAQGGLGLLSHTISVHSLQKFIPLIPREEMEEERKEKEEEGTREREEACCFSVAGAKEREERVRGI